MKTNLTGNRTLTEVCRACYERVAGQIRKVRDAVLGEFGEALRGKEHLLELAVNEAEALAWATDYPQLTFPTLAIEKAQSVVAWQEHQRAVRRQAAGLAHAA